MTSVITRVLLRGKEEGQSQRRCNVLGRGWREVSISHGMSALEELEKARKRFQPHPEPPKENSPVPFIPDSPPEL